MSRRRRARWGAVAVVAAVGLASASLTAASALGGSARSEATRGGGKALLMLPAGDPDHLDPALWYTFDAWKIGFVTCTTLVTLPDKAGQAGKVVVGGLADMPRVSNGGRTYTFKLRPGITFSTGKPITPADIKWTFTRLLLPAMASPAAGFFGDIVGADKVLAGKTKDLPGIVTGPDSVTFKLTKPSGSLLYRITMRFTCPVPAGTPAKAIENGSLPSSGPYMIKTFTPSRELDLARNPHYAAAALGRPGKLDEIDISIGADPQQAALKVRSGAADLWLERLPPADATQALHDPSLKGRVFSNPYAAVEYLWMNNDVAPFDNVKVRQAVNYAINRLQLLRVWGGPSQGAATDQILPPTMPFWRDYHAYPDAPDLAKARQLMKESGVKTPVNTSIRVRNDIPGFVELAQVVQQDLKAIGINVEIKGAADAVNNSIIDNRKNHVAAGINEWSQDYPDPEDFVNVLLDARRPSFPQARARFADKAAVPVFDRLDKLTGAARLKAYQSADETIMRRWAPWAPLINPIEVDIVSSRVANFVWQPVYGPDLAVLSLK